MLRHTVFAVLALTPLLGCTADPSPRLVEGHIVAGLPHLACVRGEHPKSCKRTSLETAKAFADAHPTLNTGAVPIVRN